MMAFAHRLVRARCSSRRRAPFVAIKNRLNFGTLCKNRLERGFDPSHVRYAERDDAKGLAGMLQGVFDYELGNPRDLVIWTIRSTLIPWLGATTSCRMQSAPSAAGKVVSDQSYTKAFETAMRRSSLLR